MNYVFIRGLARNKYHWYGFEKLFAHNSDIIMLDIPGNGEFNKLDSKITIEENTEILREQFLKLKKNGPYTLIGISLGGMIAIDWLNRFESDFERIIVINTSAKNLARPWQRFNLKMAIAIPMLLFSSDKVIESNILKQTLNKKKIDFELLHSALNLRQFKTTKINFFKQLFSASKFIFPLNLNAEKLIVVYSENDRLVSSLSSKKIIELTNCRGIVHPSAGHDLPLDDAAWLFKTISDLVNVE